MNLHRLAETLRDYAGFGPGIVASLAVSLMACTHVGRALRVSRIHGWTLLISLGVILSATITPSREALLFGAQGTGTCDLSRIGLASLRDLSHLNDTSLNVLLLIPLGAMIGLLPLSRRMTLVVVAAIALPFAIEMAQLLLPVLDRACQSADVVDNLTGLGLGFSGGLVAGWLVRSRARQSG